MSENEKVDEQEERSDVPSGSGDPSVDSPAASKANEEAQRLVEEAGGDTPEKPTDA